MTAVSSPPRRKTVAAPVATVKTLVDAAHSRLLKARVAFGHGTTNAWDEAVYLVLHALRLPPHELALVLEHKVSAAGRRRALRLVDARIRRRVPAAYLTHEAWLGDYRFYVDARAIVPRSFIAELLRERLAPWLAPRRRIKRALDLCTGSGCLAVILAKIFPATHVDAVDISRPALAVARRNVTAYRLQRRIRVLRSDMFSALHGERYDLIIANPPYVSASAMRKLPREYRHEPHLALAGGNDGLDLVRVIMREAAQYLTAGGLLIVEVGHKRKQIENVYPHLAFVWPQTSGGDDCVFMLWRGDLERRHGVSSLISNPSPGQRKSVVPSPSTPLPKGEGCVVALARAKRRRKERRASSPRERRFIERAARAAVATEAVSPLRASRAGGGSRRR